MENAQLKEVAINVEEEPQAPVYEEPDHDKEEMSAMHFVSLMVKNYINTIDSSNAMSAYMLRDVRVRSHEIAPNFCRHYDKLRSAAEKGSTSYIMVNDFIKETEFNELINLFNEDINELTKGRDFQVYESIKFISNMLDLSYNESLIMQFYFLLGNELPYDLSMLITELPAHNENIQTFFSKSFNTSLSVFEKIVTSDHGIFTSGLLEPNTRYKNHYKIISKVHDLLGPTVILTDDILEERLFPSILDTKLDISNYEQQEDIKIMTDMINKSIGGQQIGSNVLLWGLPGTGKTELPLILAKDNNWELKIIGDIGRLDSNEKARNERLLALNVAQRLFRNTGKRIVLLFDEMEDLFKFDQNAQHSKAFINRIIEKTPVPVIWTTNDMHILGSATIRRMTFNIPFNKPPSASVRKNIWEKYAKEYNLDISEDKMDSLARNYDVVPALIANVTKIAHFSNLNEDQLARVLKNLDMAMNFGEERKFEEDNVGNGKFKIEFTNTTQNLNDITQKIMKSGKYNFNVLSYGPSGTGKSAYGVYLADKLKMKVKIKKASDILSMWVGGTEKNIAAMFEEAMDSNMFLILDEADSFFQNRGNASRSWEVTQVNEMLVQMEKHKLPFLCTTNLEETIDPAAFRRFTFKIGYNYLNPTQRVNIYEHYFGKMPPTGSLNDYEYLAPGDFANIYEKMNFLGDLDNSEILKMLKEECEIKPTYKRKIGF